MGRATEGRVTPAQSGEEGTQPAQGPSEEPHQHPQDQSAAGPLPTYHALHLLGDVIVSVAVGGLHVRLRLALTLGAELQVSGQRAAASLVPAQRSATSDPPPLQLAPKKVP